MNEKKSVGLAVTSMVLGIVSLLFGCCFWYVTIPAAIIAVILAAVSISKKMSGKGMAITGLVTSIISLVPAIIVLVTGSSLMANFSSEDASKEKNNNNESNIVEESFSFSDDELLGDREENTSSDNEKEKTTVSDSKKKTTVKIANHSLSTDFEGNDIILVDYEFYNGEKDEITFLTKFTASVYQNGIECDSLVFMGIDSDIDLNKDLTKIQPDATYTVTKAYKLNDMSDVEIIVTGWLSDKEYLKETISFE